MSGGAGVDDSARGVAGAAPDPARAAASVASLASGDGLDELYALYDVLRESDPIHRSTHPQFPRCWFVSSYAAVDAVLRDKRFVQDARNSEVFAGTEGPFADMVSRILIFLPPGGPHERTRSLIYRAFTPRRVEARRGRIEALVDDLVGRLVRAGGGDLLHDVFYALPMVVIGELLGATEEEQATLSELFRAQGQEVSDVGSASDEQRKAADEMIVRFEDEVRRMIERCRRAGGGGRSRAGEGGAGGEGILHTLIAANDEGDRLSEREILAAVYILIGAGHETTANLLGNGVAHLLGPWRGEWERLVAEPALVPSAVEELLRFDTSVQWNQRVANEACSFLGVEMDEDDRVIVLLGAANRDPGVFAEPHRLDVGRDPNPHLAFGAGLYHCLGVHLARLEMQVALGALVRRVPGMKLVGEPRMRRTWMMTGLEGVEVEVEV